MAAAEKKTKAQKQAAKAVAAAQPKNNGGTETHLVIDDPTYAGGSGKVHSIYDNDNDNSAKAQAEKAKGLFARVWDAIRNQ